MRMTQSAINQRDEFLEAEREGAEAPLAGGGFFFHRIPQRPRRLRLLVVMLKLLAICDKSDASCSFLSRFPAKPLPACTSLSRFFNTSEEDSMFFTATVISALLVASTKLRLVAKRSISREKLTRLLAD